MSELERYEMELEKARKQEFRETLSTAIGVAVVTLTLLIIALV